MKTFKFHSDCWKSRIYLNFYRFLFNLDAAPAEAVKRKIPAEADATDAAATDEACPTPEKKTKLDDAAKENGAAAAEAEVVA